MYSFSFKKVNSTHENMIRAVVAFALAAANIAITTSVAAFLTIINALKANITTIDTLRALIATPIKGYAAQKKALKTALVELTVTAMKATYAYAVANQNWVLAAQMKGSRGVVNRMKYVDLVTFSQAIIDLINPLVADLADYGITAGTITAMQNVHDQLEGVISNPKNAIANHEAVNKSIQEVLRQCLQLLTDQADAVAFQFIENNVQYYNNYRANRKLNPHYLSTQLRAHVQDELDQPIIGAVISVDTVDGNKHIGITNQKGYALVSHIPFGSWSVTVTVGKVSKVYGPYHFKKGHSLTVHFITAPEFGGSATVTETPTVTIDNQ
jgi:hypothetical protein